MIIVEDGTGVDSSNSYVSLAEAQAYFDDLGYTVTATEVSLKQATRYLDLRFGDSYAGKRASKEQSLLWPRTAFLDSDQFVREANTIPKELKVGTYEAARLILSGTDLFNDVPAEDENLQSITNTVEGAVSQTKTWFSPTRKDPRLNLGKYLKPILDVDSGINLRVK